MTQLIFLSPKALHKLNKSQSNLIWSPCPLQTFPRLTTNLFLRSCLETTFIFIANLYKKDKKDKQKEISSLKVSHCCWQMAVPYPLSPSPTATNVDQKYLEHETKMQDTLWDKTYFPKSVYPSELTYRLINTYEAPTVC